MQGCAHGIEMFSTAGFPHTLTRQAETDQEDREKAFYDFFSRVWLITDSSFFFNSWLWCHWEHFQTQEKGDHRGFDSKCRKIECGWRWRLKRQEGTWLEPLMVCTTNVCCMLFILWSSFVIIIPCVLSLLRRSFVLCVNRSCQLAWRISFVCSSEILPLLLGIVVVFKHYSWPLFFQKGCTFLCVYVSPFCREVSKDPHGERLLRLAFRHVAAVLAQRLATVCWLRNKDGLIPAFLYLILSYVDCPTTLLSVCVCTLYKKNVLFSFWTSSACVSLFNAYG